MKKSSDNYKSPVRRHDTAKQISTDAMSSTSSFTDSDWTCSMMTPSLEFPDRISFRKMDLSEAGPSGVVVTSNSTNRDITKLMPPPVSRGNKPTLIRRNHSLIKEIIARMKKSSGRRGDKITPVRRLERRDAAKHINYDAASSSSSSAQDLYVSTSSSSLEVPGHTSFRIGGAEGENWGGIERKPTILVKSKGYLVPNDAVAVGGGIKGVRPPVLKLPPSMKRPPIDLQDSSWDFLTHFAPESVTVRRPSSSSSSENGCDEEEAGGEKVGIKETGDMFNQLGDTADEACSFTTNEGDSSSTVSNSSPICAYGGSIITSWQKGQLLGRGSFGSVYEGISGDGDFFAVKEVSLLDQGSHAQECIQHHEREIGLLNHHVNSDAMSSSSSSVSSDLTSSLMTPSMEFPDRISFRKIDLTEAGPSGIVVDRENTESTRSESIAIGNFNSIYEDISVDGDFFAVKEVSFLDQGSHTQECIQQLEGDIGLLNNHVNFDAMSSSSSFVSSNLTSSLMTPSMEFPDRISFRKIDLTEAGPSGIVVDRENTESTRSKSIAIGNFNNPMGLVTSWLNDQLLGRRSFDSIYEDISVKCRDRDQTQECIQQLEGEIALLSQLQHQNIVQYRGTAKDGSKLYIFLELVSQGSLLKLYQRYQLRNSVVSTYTRQILDGLKYLHDKGFIHRDIKCANILVDANGTVKLADFGLAKVSKFCKGTPFWMAPEVINPKRNDGYGSPADIWSLGCTVLEMLTGQIPYGSLEPVQALFRIGRGTLPEIPDTLSLDAQNFVIECLKVNPEERPTAAELLNHPFVRRPLPSMGSGGLILASPLLHRQG